MAGSVEILDQSRIDALMESMKCSAPKAARLPGFLAPEFKRFLRSATEWFPVTWRSRLYGTELVRIFILGDAIHRIWGPDVEWRPSWRVA